MADEADNDRVPERALALSEVLSGLVVLSLDQPRDRVSVLTALLNRFIGRLPPAQRRASVEWVIARLDETYPEPSEMSDGPKTTG